MGFAWYIVDVCMVYLVYVHWKQGREICMVLGLWENVK